MNRERISGEVLARRLDVSGPTVRKYARNLGISTSRRGYDPHEAQRIGESLKNKGNHPTSVIPVAFETFQGPLLLN